VNFFCVVLFCFVHHHAVPEATSRGLRALALPVRVDFFLPDEPLPEPPPPPPALPLPLPLPRLEDRADPDRGGRAAEATTGEAEPGGAGRGVSGPPELLSPEDRRVYLERTKPLLFQNEKGKENVRNNNNKIR
jgi:hypothetical protein